MMKVQARAQGPPHPLSSHPVFATSWKMRYRYKVCDPRDKTEKQEALALLADSKAVTVST